jgi:hypothetical protein
VDGRGDSLVPFAVFPDEAKSFTFPKAKKAGGAETQAPWILENLIGGSSGTARRIRRKRTSVSGVLTQNCGTIVQIPASLLLALSGYWAGTMLLIGNATTNVACPGPGHVPSDSSSPLKL